MKLVHMSIWRNIKSDAFNSRPSFCPFCLKLFLSKVSLKSGCAMALRRDFEYWGLDELLIEPCCAIKYYPALEVRMI